MKNLKGKAIIQLFDESGTEILRQEEENMMTNAIQRILSVPFEYAYKDGWSEVVKNIMPIETLGLGGIMLWDSELEEDPDLVIQKNPDVHELLHAGGVYNGGNHLRGTYIESDSGKIPNGYRHVWEFGAGTAEALNIKCLTLTSQRGGNCGYHANVDNEDIYQLILSDVLKYPSSTPSICMVGEAEHNRFYAFDAKTAFYCFENFDASSIWLDTVYDNPVTEIPVSPLCELGEHPMPCPSCITAFTKMGINEYLYRDGIAGILYTGRQTYSAVIDEYTDEVTGEYVVVRRDFTPLMINKVIIEVSKLEIDWWTYTEGVSFIAVIPTYSSAGDRGKNSLIDGFVNDASGVGAVAPEDIGIDKVYYETSRVKHSGYVIGSEKIQFVCISGDIENNDVSLDVYYTVDYKDVDENKTYKRYMCNGKPWTDPNIPFAYNAMEYLDGVDYYWHNANFIEPIQDYKTGEIEDTNPTNPSLSIGVPRTLYRSQSGYKPMYTYRNIEPLKLMSTQGNNTRLMLFTPYIASINNLQTPIDKLHGQTMRITYEITEEESEVV